MKHERFWKAIIVFALALQFVRSEVDWASFKSFADASIILEYSQTGYLLTLGTQVHRLREFMSQIYGEPHKEPDVSAPSCTKGDYFLWRDSKHLWKCENGHFEIMEPRGCPGGQKCG